MTHFDNSVTRFKIFLDLEETVINSWADGLLVNTGKLRQFIKDHGASHVNIFSFAIWHKSDVEEFEKRLLKPIETALDVRVLFCPSVTDMMEIDTAVTGLRFDSLTDFIAIRGKMDSFRNVCRARGEKHAILVDDVVSNIDIVNRDNHGIIRFVNVNTL